MAKESFLTTVKLPPDDRAKLEALAAVYDTTLTAAVRMALQATTALLDRRSVPKDVREAWAENGLGPDAK